MKWFTKAIGAIFGGGKTTEKALDLTDKAFHTAQEKSEADSKDVSEARVTPLAPSHGTWLDVIIDGLNRMPRPFIIFYTTLGIVGLYDLPDINKLDPYWITVFERVLYFIFGARFVSQDLPKAIAGILALRRK
jgi:hypothetical protein